MIRKDRSIILYNIELHLAIDGGKKVITSQLMEKIKRKIVQASHPEKIILFGSYATGQATDASDIDLLIIKSTIRSKINEVAQIRQQLDPNYSFDILLATSKEYEFYKQECGSIFREIDLQGKIIYDRLHETI